ncbi:hypothetical protein BWI17_02030 [Betaproteobacteria bacterium GR16-43]|nr:hypothetical protein BWI17_02030 [Betaproteobacteria bacterium GR16-43]
MNTPDNDIVVNAANSPHFTTYSNALRAAGLESAYKGTGPFTVFAPTNDAFEKLPDGALNALLKDKAKLASVLNFHATRGAIYASEMRSHELPSLQGEALAITRSGTDLDTGFSVNGANGSKKEIEASNGIIHGIDTVMMPKG